MDAIRCLYLLSEAAHARGSHSSFVQLWIPCPVWWNDDTCGMFDIPSCWPHSVAELSSRLGFTLHELKHVSMSSQVYVYVDTVRVWFVKPPEFELLNANYCDGRGKATQT